MLGLQHSMENCKLGIQLSVQQQIGAMKSEVVKEIRGKQLYSRNIDFMTVPYRYG